MDNVEIAVGIWQLLAIKVEKFKPKSTSEAAGRGDGIGAKVLKLEFDWMTRVETRGAGSCALSPAPTPRKTTQETKQKRLTSSLVEQLWSG